MLYRADMTAEQIEKRIKSAWADCDVAVFDTTGTSNHFDVRVASRSFAGKSRIDQHKSVMDLFSAELKSGEVHALQIKTIAKLAPSGT